MIRTAATMAILAMLTAAAWAQVTVTGSPGATLDSLADSGALVTVTLKSGAKDANLTVTEAAPEYVALTTRDGRRRTYRFADIQSIHVQGGQVDTPRRSIAERGALTAEHQQIVDRAAARAYDLFQAMRDEQTIRMGSATLVIISGDAGQKQEAEDYLFALYTGSDLGVAMEAGVSLFLASRTDLDSRVIQNGLDSGNRDVRASAARLAGLLGYMGDGTQLNRMARERSAELSAPAVVALAQLGDRSIIPTLMSNLSANSDEVGDAAVLGLSLLGGDHVIEQVKRKALSASGIERYRTASVLHNLGDPQGTETLKNTVMKEPSLTVDTAMILASEGDFEAMELLRERLDRRFDEDVDSLRSRASMTAALVKGDDQSKIATLQELIRWDEAIVQVYTLGLLPDIGLRTLITVTSPAIESGNAYLCFFGCEAALALGNPEYRARRSKFRSTRVPWLHSGKNWNSQ
jgi:HEAT repeat protein